MWLRWSKRKKIPITIWEGTSEKDIRAYNISDQQRLRWACAIWRKLQTENQTLAMICCARSFEGTQTKWQLRFLLLWDGSLQEARQVYIKDSSKPAYFSNSMTKPRKWHVQSAKTQISLSIRAVWAESLLCTQWETKDPRFINVDSEDWSDWVDARADQSSLVAQVILLVLSCCGSFVQAHQNFPPWLIWRIDLRKNFRQRAQSLAWLDGYTCIFEPRHVKTNKMAVRPAKTQISLGIRPVWSVFAVRMKKAWALSYPLSAQRWLWSDWVDAQADLSLRWAHTHFVFFFHVVAHFKVYFIKLHSWHGSSMFHRKGHSVP